MAAFAGYLKQTSLNPLHQELIRTRASQINGCAYCIDMPAGCAKQSSGSMHRMPGAKPRFTEEGKAIPALTKEVTLIQQKVSEATYERALEVLGEQCLAEVIIAATVINAWNRIGISTELMPALAR